MKKSKRIILSILLFCLGIAIDIILNSPIHDFDLKFLLYYLYFILPGIILGVTSFLTLPKTISTLSNVLIWMLVLGSVFVYIIASMDIFIQPVRDIKNYSLVFKELKEHDVNLNGYYPQKVPQNTLQAEMTYLRPFLQGGLLFSLKLKYNKDNFNSEARKIENKYNFSSSDNGPVTYKVFHNKKGNISSEIFQITLDKAKNEIVYSYNYGH